MLSASLLQQSGEFKDAIDYALKAETILLQTDEIVASIYFVIVIRAFEALKNNFTNVRNHQKDR
jgi:hypothetical protein